MKSKIISVLLAVITTALMGATQIVFSVEKISEEEYMQAENTSADYNIYPQRIDSIAHSAIINKIFQDAKESG